MKKSPLSWPSNPFRRFSAPTTMAERLEDEAWYLADNFLIAKELAIISGCESGNNAERRAVSKIDGFRVALLAIDTPDTEKLLLLFSILTARIKDKELKDLYESEHFYLGSKYLQYYEVEVDRAKIPLKTTDYAPPETLESPSCGADSSSPHQNGQVNARATVQDHERSGARALSTSLQMRPLERERSYRLYSNGLLRQRRSTFI